MSDYSHTESTAKASENYKILNEILQYPVRFSYSLQFIQQAHFEILAKLRKKETLAQVFPCEIFKNAFSTEHIQATTSAPPKSQQIPCISKKLILFYLAWTSLSNK